jgi:hydroxyethylthiazole kinase-like uncharacterized protein yjeF
MRLPAPLLRREPRVHKQSFGHVLVVAGSPPMLGAACLTAVAAMRAGAGLVTAAIPKELNTTLQTKLPYEIMTHCVAGGRDNCFSLKDAHVLLDLANRYTSMALGPGLGIARSTLSFARALVAAAPLPLVVDADALNALPGCLDILKTAKGPRVLTPHAGEFARMTGDKIILSDKVRLQAAAAFAREFQVILVLKGHRTVVAYPDGTSYVNRTGNAGMAKAGMGDVLTGMIAGLLAQGVSPQEAARFAVYWHGLAGDKAVMNIAKASLTAGDVVATLGRVI